jgi:hypothetical protein
MCVVFTNKKQINKVKQQNNKNNKNKFYTQGD